MTTVQLDESGMAAFREIHPPDAPLVRQAQRDVLLPDQVDQGRDHVSRDLVAILDNGTVDHGDA